MARFPPDSTEPAMLPLPTDHLDPDAPGRPAWQVGVDFLLGAAIVCAVALMSGFLRAPPAHAEAPQAGTDRQATLDARPARDLADDRQAIGSALPNPREALP